MSSLPATQQAIAKQTISDRADPQPDQQQAAAVAPDEKHKQQCSRWPVPTSKQKQQAALSKHLLDMKEYLAEVPSRNEPL